MGEAWRQEHLELVDEITGIVEQQVNEAERNGLGGERLREAVMRAVGAACWHRAQPAEDTDQPAN